MKQFFLKIASLLYGFVIRTRHWLFDIGVLRSRQFDIPIICVGNITVGGTGKTPIVELLVSHFSKSHKVAVISRGYGRKTKGYLEVQTTSSYRDVGDEPLQIKRKFPEVPIVVCERRVEGIERLCEEFPDVNLVIMDDGFQHRHIRPFINIIMVDSTRPVQEDHLLPYGQLRDSVSSLHRAHYFIVTKCSDNMTPITMRLHNKVLVSKPSQKIFFTRVRSAGLYTVFGDEPVTLERGTQVVAMSGIGNSEVFNSNLAQTYDVMDSLDFEDHHTYRLSDLALMRKVLQTYPEAYIVTTEKDAVKLCNSSKITDDVRARLLYERMSTNFICDSGADFLKKISTDISEYQTKGRVRF